MVKRGVMDEKEIKTVWKDISRNVITDYPSLSQLVIVGIRCRGDILASRMVKEIKKEREIAVSLGILDITLYRDDFTTVGPEPVVGKTEINFDINGKNVILVDDVLFSGRTIRAAMDALIDFGRPASIRLAVLIDRGGRELPIQPDYVAKKLHISPKEIVRVKLKEFDGEERVSVTTQKLKEGCVKT